jgi:hypothetical protein
MVFTVFPSKPAYCQCYHCYGWDHLPFEQGQSDNEWPDLEIREMNSNSRAPKAIYIQVWLQTEFHYVQLPLPRDSEDDTQTAATTSLQETGCE